METHSLKERLEKQMALKGLSVPQLEKRAGVKRNVARNMLEGKSTWPNAHNLEAIAGALDCAHNTSCLITNRHLRRGPCP
jgi:transcriptional regulator with XRE-family HTH domain